MAEGQRDHAIRLHGAWEVRWLTERPSENCDPRELIGGQTPDARVNLRTEPVDVAPPDCVAILLTRRFNRPSNLSPQQPIHLKLEGLPATARIHFNGEWIEAPADSDTVSIQRMLQDSNRLDLVLPDAEFLALGDVRLVIADVSAS